MLPYFTRLRLAFRTFFAILDYARVPDEVMTALDMRPAAEPPPAPAPPAPVTMETPAAADDPARAAQMLAILQRDGRLVDFLMEDIAPYADAQIGAAARDVHSGARQALLRYLTLDPVLDGQEGGTVTVPAGTDAAAVKVIGQVAGAPPYQGVLRHRGWRASRLDLPPLPSADRLVIAPAEVEVP